jgi:nitrogen fixation protein NifQ
MPDGFIDGIQILHRRLMTEGNGDPFDRHVLASALVHAAGEAPRPITESLGLAKAQLLALIDTYFATSQRDFRRLRWQRTAGEDALEEPDLRRLLIEHRSHGIIEEEWLAAIIARRSLKSNHLWQDLGLANRGELSRLMQRHFGPLARRNSGDMKWKKFFYRELCARDGVVVCRAPNCNVCDDAAVCFGPEEGEPLNAFQRPLLEKRQNPAGVRKPSSGS